MFKIKLKGPKPQNIELASTSVEIFRTLKGDKGDNGYTPVKGVDYFTPEEIEEMTFKVGEEVSGKIPAMGHSMGSVTPQMYGAAADGITDDTRAVQRALDSGKNVYFPEGVYKVTRQLTAVKPCVITMAKPYPSDYGSDYPVDKRDMGMGARIHTYVTNDYEYGMLIGDGVQVDGLYLRLMSKKFTKVLLKYDGTQGTHTYPSHTRLAHIKLDNDSTDIIPLSMFDFNPTVTWMCQLEDITIGSLKIRQHSIYGLRTILTDWANSVRIKNLCVDILADYPLYIDGNGHGCENWIFEGLGIQSYPYGTDRWYYRDGHVNIITLKNMQNPVFIGADIYDLHAATVLDSVLKIEGTEGLACINCNGGLDEADTWLNTKLQKAADNLNISMLDMAVERDLATGDSTLVLTDGTRQKTIGLPSAVMTDSQINNGIGKWMSENSRPVTVTGKNKLNLMSSDTVNGYFYYWQPSDSFNYEPSPTMTTANYIKAEENDTVSVVYKNMIVGFFGIVYLDKDKKIIQVVETHEDGAVSHKITNPDTAYVRLMFTGATVDFADRENAQVMVLLNYDPKYDYGTDLFYRPYTETVEDGTFTKIVSGTVNDFLAENPISMVITDRGGYYESSDMEGALQEIGRQLSRLEGSIDSAIDTAIEQALAGIATAEGRTY